MTRNDKRNHILGFLLARETDGELERGAMSAAAKAFSCSRLMVKRVWVGATICRASPSEGDRDAGRAMQ